MNDKEILKDREAKYGKPREFFKAYGAMCEILDRYACMGQGEANYAHLSAMKMVILKVLRSVWNPGLKDNFADARNYITIAEKCEGVEDDDSRS
jgi:hypothetical protein